MLREENILYEDNHLLVLNKRSGELVQGDKTGDTPLSELAKGYLKKKYNKPGNVFCGVTHRLDRVTSGVLVLARTSKALERMNKLFREREVEKVYWAVVGTQPDPVFGHLENWLIKDQSKNKSKAYNKNVKYSKHAILDYRLAAESDRYYLLRVQPKTGRHHQIRVQLSKIGCPIKGDVKYGFDRPNKDKSIHLHCREINFTHPIKQEKMKFRAETPEDVVWNVLAEKVAD